MSERWEKQMDGFNQALEKSADAADFKEMSERLQQYVSERDQARALYRATLTSLDATNAEAVGLRFDIDQARAQVKALREALERIENPLIATKASIANRIAREALAATEPSQ